MAKHFKDIQAGDTFYYYPGRAVAGPDDKLSVHTVSKVERNNNVVDVFCDDFNQGLYPFIHYCVGDIDCDSFADKYGYYSTRDDGVQELYNSDINRNIKFLQDETIRVAQENNQKIKELQSLLMK